MLIALLVACALCSAAEPTPADRQPLLTILFTAEAHGALLPCDCPLQPLGGIARRAAAIERYRQRGPVLLIDAGGWSAGGMYDDDSDGDPQRDHMRTRLMAQAMAQMNYDFIVATPDEEALLRDAYEPADPRGAKLGDALTRLLTREPNQFLLRRKNAAVKLPHALQLQLSRMGEDAAALPPADLTINAGRKSSQRVSWRNAAGMHVNFDFQAQRLGVAEVFGGANGAGYELRVRHESLGADLPDHPALAVLLKPHLDSLRKKGRERVDVEFWTMPECPGCRDAWPELDGLRRDLGGRVNLTLRFVVNKRDGKLTSLHGERELQEARVQAVVQQHYPDRIWDWLGWREKNPLAGWEDGARTLGLLAARIRGALNTGEADALLEADYDLARRRRIEGTPTLVIANRTYDQPLERPHMLRVLCGLLNDPKPAACANVPACFFDAQCRKRGFIGKCVNAGKPGARCDTARPALKVPATVLIDGDNIASNHERIMEILISDLPGIEFTLLDINLPAGRELAAKAGIERLPAYILDTVAKSESGYDDGVGKVAYDEPNTNKLVLKSYTVGANRVLNRVRQKGRIDLFVSRFSRNGQEALETALDTVRELGVNAPQLVLHDVIYWNQNAANEGRRELAAPGGLSEIEDAARALAVRKLAPDKYLAYLLERGKRRGSSYWDVALKAVGIDAAKVRELAEGPADEILNQLHAEADLLKSLDTGGEIVVLAENCEVVSVLSRHDLRQTIEKIAQRK